MTPPPSSPSAQPRGICANCMCPVDRHDEKTKDGLGCSTAIAVSWADGPVGCECERCIPQGTKCGVDGCGADAVHYRVNRDHTKAFDMCVNHYEEAEPYCERYDDLTGGDAERQARTCEADGCAQPAALVRYDDQEGYGQYRCKAHRRRFDCNEDAPERRDCNEPLRTAQREA